MDEQIIQPETEDTTPQEPVQDGTTDDTAEVTPTEEQDTGTADTFTAEGEQAAIEEQPKPFMSISYNHENVDLNEDEARDWAQKGMHYFKKLDYIAAQSDCSVGEMLDSIIKKMDEQKRAELEEQFGDDVETIDALMQVFHDKQKDKYESVVNMRNAAEKDKVDSRNAQIAEEFVALQKEFPNLTSISDIPGSVLKAAKEGMPLPYAYLLYDHNNNKKIKENAAKEQEAAKSSAGSVSSPSTENEDSAEAAFLKGLWH